MVDPELMSAPVIYAADKNLFTLVLPVHVLSLARYQQSFSSSVADDDRQDAWLAG